MGPVYELENKLMNDVFAELKSHRKLSRRLKDEVRRTFGERFTNGWKLVSSRKVRRYDFRPSGRVVWVVQGRRGAYQVMPEIPFCYCDDYYFRVMDKKRGLCYHIIAQRIAEALNRFRKTSTRDSQYSSITNRWRAKEREEETDQ